MSEQLTLPVDGGASARILKNYSSNLSVPSGALLSQVSDNLPIIDEAVGRIVSQSVLSPHLQTTLEEDEEDGPIQMTFSKAQLTQSPHPAITQLRRQHRLRSNSSSRMSLKDVRALDQLDEPCIYSQGGTELPQADILSELCADAPQNILEEIRSQKRLDEPLLPSPPALDAPPVPKQIVAPRKPAASPRPPASSKFAKKRSTLEGRNDAKSEMTFDPHSESDATPVKSLQITEKPPRAGDSSVGAEDSFQSSDARKRKSSKKAGIRIVSEKEVPLLIERLSSSALFRQKQSEQQRSMETKISSKYVSPRRPGSRCAVVHQEREENEKTIKHARDSQDTIGRGSEKTLPRHAEQSPSEVRMLSPVVRGRREEESPSTRGPAVSSDFSQNLLKITSKQEIIYAPPRQESSLSPSKTQFEENFMKQLRAEVSDESSLGLKKRSSDLGDMNEVVQNLDRKKLEMLRSFIASPFDTIGSRHQIDVVSSSGSGSSINTLKNAPRAPPPQFLPSRIPGPPVPPRRQKQLLRRVEHLFTKEDPLITERRLVAASYQETQRLVPGRKSRKATPISTIEAKTRASSIRMKRPSPRRNPNKRLQQQQQYTPVLDSHRAARRGSTRGMAEEMRQPAQYFGPSQPRFPPATLSHIYQSDTSFGFESPETKAGLSDISSGVWQSRRGLSGISSGTGLKQTRILAASMRAARPQKQKFRAYAPPSRPSPHRQQQQPRVPKGISREIRWGRKWRYPYDTPSGGVLSHSASPVGRIMAPLSSQGSSLEPELKVVSQQAKEVVQRSFREQPVLRKISGLLMKQKPALSPSQITRPEIIDAEAKQPRIDPDSEDMGAALSSGQGALSVLSFTSSQGPSRDWADTPIYRDFLQGGLQPQGLYSEKDVDYILDMLKHKYKDFKRSSLTEAFFHKARCTLEKLMSDLALSPQFESLARKYPQANLENTLRFLIRTKLLLRARGFLHQIFGLISRRDALSASLTRMLGSGSGALEDPVVRGNIFDLNREMKVATSQIMKTLSAFQTEFKQFRGRFVFFDRVGFAYQSGLRASDARRCEAGSGPAPLVVSRELYININQSVSQQQSQPCTRSSSRSALPRFTSTLIKGYGLFTNTGLRFFTGDGLSKGLICLVLSGGRLAGSGGALARDLKICNRFCQFMSAAIFPSLNLGQGPLCVLLNKSLFPSAFRHERPLVLIPGSGSKDDGNEGQTVDFPDNGLRIKSPPAAPPRGMLPSRFRGKFLCGLSGFTLNCSGISILCLSVLLKNVSKLTNPFTAGFGVPSSSPVYGISQVYLSANSGPALPHLAYWATILGLLSSSLDAVFLGTGGGGLFFFYRGCFILRFYFAAGFSGVAGNRASFSSLRLDGMVSIIMMTLAPPTLS